MSHRGDKAYAVLYLNVVGIHRLLYFIQHNFLPAGYFAVRHDYGKRVYSRRHMLEADIVIFEYGKHLARKTYFAVHHRLFDIDYAVPFLARDTRYRIAAAAVRDFGNNHSALVFRLERVADIYGYSAGTHGENALGVQDVRAHIGKLPQFAVGKLPYSRRVVHYSGIRGQKTVYVRPVFVKFRIDRFGYQRARDIRTAPAESVDKPAVVRAVKAGNYRVFHARKFLFQLGARGCGVEFPARSKGDDLCRVHKGKAEERSHYPAAEIFAARSEVFRTAVLVHTVPDLVKAGFHIQVDTQFVRYRRKSFAYLFKGRVEIAVHFQLVEAFVKQVGDLYIL